MEELLELGFQSDLTPSTKYDKIRLPSDLIDLSRYDYVTDPSPEDFDALKADVRKLEIESKVKEILSPIFQPFQNENDLKERVIKVSREFYAYLQNAENIDTELCESRVEIVHKKSMTYNLHSHRGQKASFISPLSSISMIFYY